ncbi:centromere/kinetochore protein zw10 homolog isoform X2 [Phymastichus coffea]|uniref:centromere/kinetochore protein zw10 homolog isoform X2 n=1 Tax=Phymastichus coffea TaxID=108790 RepID=UPI00273B9B1A|nr:centromere/kinetochore protein zw10 homolog isoform X2 [Phymastichus coffea]
MSQLLEIHKCFESIKKYKDVEEQRCTTAAITLIKLYSLVMEKNSDIQQLYIYNAIKDEYHRVYDSFIEDITTLWQEKVCWNNKNEGNSELSIKCELDELTDIVKALHHMNRLIKCMDILSSKLLQHFINPIIHSDCFVQSTNTTFSVEILNKKRAPKYKAVLDNLKLLFQYLYEHFDVLIKDEEHFLTKLSQSMFKEFSCNLTNDCISKVIPTSTAELETFQYTVSEIEEFQNYLVKIKFIDENEKFLSKYTSNIDDLYIDKKCEKLLEMARIIMKKDLHDSFRYKPEDILNFPNLEGDFECGNKVIDRKLSRYTFQLPECQISKSAREILQLVEDILQEASNISSRYVLRLFYTTRNIFEMYAALIPEIHKSFLETIPQQVALFHNSCMYLAHHLLTLAQKYKSIKSVTSQNFSLIYVDQTLLLRQVGSEYFLNHMKYQRDIIFEILREAGLSSIGQMPQLPVTTERALRQCIRQLELLKTVWIEILPIKVYCRALGCIVNDMVDDICTKIINIEDIPADIASELVSLFDTVVKRIPQIFPEPALIEYHVQKWRKLKELIILLGASLKEIEDRWADGKGPLANEFTPHHIKQLIRALFQNTERRSNLLVKIKEK